MTLLSRKVDYALLILSYLYHHKSGGTARAIAEQFGLSRPFVANILKELCQKEFVVSHRGVKGGYALAHEAANISLADLLEAIDEGFQLTLCNHDSAHGSLCEHSRACTVKTTLAEVHQRLMDVLRRVTLGELFDPHARPPALHALPVIEEIAACRPPAPVSTVSV